MKMRSRKIGLVEGSDPLTLQKCSVLFCSVLFCSVLFCCAFVCERERESNTLESTLRRVLDPLRTSHHLETH